MFSYSYQESRNYLYFELKVNMLNICYSSTSKNFDQKTYMMCLNVTPNRACLCYYHHAEDHFQRNGWCLRPHNWKFLLKAHSQVWDNFWQLEALWKRWILNAFYFTLKTIFILKIAKFLSWFFGHIQKRLN